eukprot:gene3991-4270_t
MPRTRRQLATLKEKTYVPIPAKNDISLFQKSGNCIEGLPLPIFQIIQTYLNEIDYRDLMNCNLSTFQPIKYETVKYTIIGPERWIHIDSLHDENKEDFYHRLTTQTVKDKSKQITLSIKEIKEPVIMKSFHVFDGLYKLFIDNLKTNKKKFNFNIFNNIYHVILKEFSDSIEVIDSGFNNVVRLELIMFYGLYSISNINQDKTLKELKITQCGGIKELDFPVDNIPIVYIDCRQLLRIKSFKNHNQLTVMTATTPLPTMMDDLITQLTSSSSSSSSNLNYLKLIIDFPVDFNQFEIFQTIPELWLSPYNTRQEHSFPLYYGENLTLRRFNISSWNNYHSDPAAFTRLTKLNLSYCKGLTDLPLIPQLIELKLDYCYGLRSLPTFLQLKTLHIRNCSDLVTISSIQPSLREVEIVYCKNLMDISFASNIKKSFILRQCDLISNISMLKNIPILTIDSCLNITSLSSLSGESLESDRRKVFLSKLKKVKDLSGICNIHYLELFDVTGIVNGDGIHDIYDLVVKFSPNVNDTKGFLNIRNSLTLQNCLGLRKLNGLAGIPKVNIIGCWDLDDYSDLFNHDVVTIKGINATRMKVVKDFQRDHQIKSLIFLDSNSEVLEAHHLE